MIPAREGAALVVIEAELSLELLVRAFGARPPTPRRPLASHPPLRWPTLFATEVFQDAWSDFNGWSSDHAVAAQALDKVLVCRGGPREHAFSAHAFGHEVDCHVVSARTGATLGGFKLTDYAVSEVDSALLAAPNGADFLIARANMIGSITTELHIDRLTVGGVLTKDIVAPVPIGSTYIEQIVETGPNQYAIMYRDISPGPISVCTLGCTP